MSPRPKRLRKISNPPPISGFRPYGGKHNKSNNDAVFLEYEEYESIRLCDFERLNHFEASEIMNVSRPTLTRIYSKAREKMSEALVLGKQIIIEGGKVYFDSEWFACNSCGCYFNNPDKEVETEECPLCGSKAISIYEDFEYDDVSDASQVTQNICVCPSCGYAKPHSFGTPCRKEVCPECQHHLVRKESQHYKRI
ncbi:MAG TPA: DUF134 domain-containing protein [Bacteroidales bacterium]|nr:DUF134 domain-containing protein [Bacteroidales bacterium]